MARSTEGDMSSGDEVVTEATPCMEEEGMSGGPPGLYNGHLVLTVSTESAWWDPRFEYDHCREMLAQHGFQVPPEDLELPLRRALDSPDVRRFLFFNSALFLTLLAPALYLVIWCCLYSSFHVLGTPFSQTYFAAFCLVLSAAAVMVTGAIILVLNHYHGKISVNMEVRLTQANELLRKHNLLVGLSDRMKNCTSQLFLIFCYFGVSECLKRLTDMLDREHKSTQDLQRKMKRKFGSICVVVIQDSGRPRLCGSRNECVHSEETPLLEAEREAEPGRPLTGTTSSWACCMAPVGPPQIQGKWHLISSAYQKEEQRNLDKQDTFGWMEIHSTDGMKFLKYGQGQQGQIVIYNHENLTFLEEDDSVKIKDNAYKISSQVHTVSDDCIVVKMNNDTDVQYSLGEFLFCRSQSGNDAEREAFKTYSNCNNLDFMVERRSNFNYATECDSVTYMKDPLDPNTITGRWQLLARASVNPIVMFVGRNPWVEFSWAEEKLKILDGHGNFHFSQEEVEVKGRNIVIGKANSTYMAFYQDCEECLLMRTENHQKVVVLQLLTRSGNYTDSQMETFQTNSRCLSLPVLYEHEVSEPHEEEGTECKSMRHILDVFVPNKISGKWHMVAKAHSQPGKMEEEDDPWLEYSYEGHNLTIHEGRGKHSWPVKEIEVRGHKIVIQKEAPFYVTFHPTCEDCLLMKTDNGMEVVLNMFTRSGKLADSEIKTFKDNAHCLNLSNVLVYKRATLHEEEAP